MFGVCIMYIYIYNIQITSFLAPCLNQAPQTRRTLRMKTLTGGIETSEDSQTLGDWINLFCHQWIIVCIYIEYSNYSKYSKYSTYSKYSKYSVIYIYNYIYIVNIVDYSVYICTYIYIVYICSKY